MTELKTNTKVGRVPSLDEWVRLKGKGWTVDSWNAEMDQRSATAAEIDANTRAFFWVATFVALLALTVHLLVSP